MMKKRGFSKRILAFVLSVMMVLALVPVNSLTVYADDDTCEHCGGTGLVCEDHDGKMECDGDNEEHCWYGTCVGDSEAQCTTTDHMNDYLNDYLDYQCRYCKGTGRKSGIHEHTYSSYVYNEVVSNPSKGFYCHKSVCDFDGCDNTDGGYCDNIGGICSVCGHNSSLTHTHSKGTHHAKVDATCNETGTLEYWDCTGCEKKLDGDANEINDITIPATGNHDFSKQPYQVDEDGKHYQKCKDCGAESTHEAHTGGTATCTTKATLTANGKKETKCSVCGKVTKTETIYAAKTIKLSATKYTYDGKAKKPTVTIKDSKGNAIASTNYTVTYPTGRKNVGKYTVKVTFKGNYSGTKNLTFTINPPKTSISKVTAGEKAFTVKWAKKTTQVTGYEIQYSTSSTFAKGNKTVKVTSAKTVSKTISKLTGGKKYYVRIRTYKTVGKTPYYSDWSAKKSVTTKK